jgi:hypothetical protein
VATKEILNRGFTLYSFRGPVFCKGTTLLSEGRLTELIRNILTDLPHVPIWETLTDWFPPCIIRVIRDGKTLHNIRFSALPAYR